MGWDGEGLDGWDGEGLGRVGWGWIRWGGMGRD